MLNYTFNLVFSKTMELITINENDLISKAKMLMFGNLLSDTLGKTVVHRNSRINTNVFIVTDVKILAVKPTIHWFYSNQFSRILLMHMTLYW